MKGAHNFGSFDHQLFVRLWNTVAKREDAAVKENFFSECFAGALNADPNLARAVAKALNRGRDLIGGTSISRSIVRAEPQFSCKSGGLQCFVDIRLHIGDRVRIGMEVKLDAPEGSLPSGDRQLRKYLNIRSLTHVACVTGYNTTVDPQVLRSARYLRPSGRQHFLWSDFYGLITQAAARRGTPHLHKELLQLFHSRRLEPMHPDLPDLSTEEGREKFRPLWRATESALRKFYPRVSIPRSNAVLYAFDPDDSTAWKIGLTPALNPGVLQLWLYMETRKSRDAALVSIRRMVGTQSGVWRGASVESRDGKGRSPHCLALWLPYRSLFQRRSSTSSKQRRLAHVVTMVVQAAGKGTVTS